MKRPQHTGCSALYICACDVYACACGTRMIQTVRCSAMQGPLGGLIISVQGPSDWDNKTRGLCDSAGLKKRRTKRPPPRWVCCGSPAQLQFCSRVPGQLVLFISWSAVSTLHPCTARMKRIQSTHFSRRPLSHALSNQLMLHDRSRMRGREGTVNEGGGVRLSLSLRLSIECRVLRCCCLQANT